jgi:hypothetical protein
MLSQVLAAFCVTNAKALSSISSSLAVVKCACLRYALRHEHGGGGGGE